MTRGFLQQYSGLVAVCILSSLALSIWCVWADPVINNDGVYYFRAAAEIADGNWREALSIYPWPFYPAVIAYLSKLPMIDLVGAAYVLNALLAALLVVGFLCAVHQLGGDRTTVVFAALLILAFPALNKYRSFIIRDIGYLAFHVWSLCFLFNYWKERSAGSLLGWAACALSACLFRVEGVAFLASVPVVMVALRWPGSRSVRWFLLVAGVAVILLLSFVLGLWLVKDTALVEFVKRAPESEHVLQALGNYLVGTVGGKLEILKEHFAGRYYFVVYVMIIVFVALAEIVRRLSLVYVILPFWGFKKGLLFPEAGLAPVWLAMIVLNTLILTGSAFFLSIVVDRYTLAVAVTILMASPFVFAHLWRRWRSPGPADRNRWPLPALLSVVLLLGAVGLNVFTDKHHLAEAGRWIRDNTPPGATLYSNNLIVIYYSGKDAYHSGDDYSWKHSYAVIKNKQWKDYDYLAIELGDTDYPWLEWLEIHLHGPPIERIGGEHGASVFIYENRLRE